MISDSLTLSSAVIILLEISRNLVSSYKDNSFLTTSKLEEAMNGLALKQRLSR
jgi:hypothetical protein